jgi:hypothetical protein
MIFCFEKQRKQERVYFENFYCFDECYIFSERFNRSDLSKLLDTLIGQGRRGKGEEINNE